MSERKRGRGRHNGHRHECTPPECTGKAGCRAKQQRTSRLRKLFNLTDADYDAVLAIQRGGCAICGRPPVHVRLNVDHRHSDGLIRGLLCWRCNKALAMFYDKVECLMAAAAYVQSPPATVALGAERFGRPGRITNKTKATPVKKAKTRR